MPVLAGAPGPRSESRGRLVTSRTAAFRSSPLRGCSAHGGSCVGWGAPVQAGPAARRPVPPPSGSERPATTPPPCGSCRFQLPPTARGPDRHAGSEATGAGPRSRASGHTWRGAARFGPRLRAVPEAGISTDNGAVNSQIRRGGAGGPILRGLALGFPPVIPSQASGRGCKSYTAHQQKTPPGAEFSGSRAGRSQSASLPAHMNFTRPVRGSAADAWTRPGKRPVRRTPPRSQRYCLG